MKAKKKLLKKRLWPLWVSILLNSAKGPENSRSSKSRHPCQESGEDRPGDSPESKAKELAKLLHEEAKAI